MGSLRSCEPQRAVEGARGAHQIFRVGLAGMPGDLFAVDGERDGEIVGGEVAVAGWVVVGRVCSASVLMSSAP